MSRVSRDEAGFTLPEMLVAIVALAIVFPAIAAAMITALRTTTGTTERLAASNDAAMTSSWFVPDVQSADSFSDADVATCPSPGTRLFTAMSMYGTEAYVAGYATLNDGTEDRTLVRYACLNGVAQPTATIGHDIDPSVGPLVTCTPSPCGSSTEHVSVTVTDTSGYSFTLNAQRRTS